MTSSLKIIEREGKRLIWCLIRKKFVSATPEELVRQKFMTYLINYKKYPKTLMAVEMPITLNGLKKRCDIVAFDDAIKPLLIVECKAPNVKLGQQTLDQAARYNMKLNVKYLMVTNGQQTYCCEIKKEKGYNFLDQIPEYKNLKS